jgi:gliding motility-associated-like protein
VDYANIGNSATIPANDSQAIITVNGLPTISAGIKSVTLYLNIGCVIDSATIFIYDAPYAQLMTHDTTICLGSSTPIFVNMDTMLAIVWTPIIGLSNPNTPNPIATPLITTTYSFTTSWAGSGCTPISDSLTIAILPQILLTATSNEPICAGATLQLNAIANPPNPQYHYQWTGPNNFTDTLSSPIINNVATDVVGTYTVTASLSSLSGCNGSATVDVTLISTPPPAVAPLILCLHTPAEAITAIGQNLLWYSDAASIIGISHAPVPNTENTGETHYYVTQTINGCTSPKSDIEVNVIECCKGSILIPSAFSPNGDGKNDLFRILVNPGYRIIEFRIYNRWGQVVYEGSKTSDGWDGTFEGKPLDMGTYYYYAQITCVGPYNILSEQKGDFMLIR